MGSSSNQTTTTDSKGNSTTKSTSTPHQQKYYDQLLGQANNLYKQGLPDYYGGSTVAGFTDAQMESMNMGSNWATQGGQDMMAGVNNNYNQMMSGQVNMGAGSPYQNMANTFQSQAMDQAQDMMGGLRSSQVMSGQQGGSSRGDLLNNQVIEGANEQVQQNMAGMYNNAYNQAQNTQNNALGQYGNVMSQPMQLSQQLYNQVGLPQQQMNQAALDNAKARYDYNAQSPYANLSQFGNYITGNFGGTNNGSSSSSGSSTTTTG